MATHRRGLSSMASRGSTVTLAAAALPAAAAAMTGSVSREETAAHTTHSSNGTWLGLGLGLGLGWGLGLGLGLGLGMAAEARRSRAAPRAASHASGRRPV